MKACCWRLLNYCLRSLYFAASKVKDLQVCWNDCFRRIFGFKHYESVNCLLNIGPMYDLQKWKLIINISKIPDKILVLYKFQNTVLNELCCKYGDNCTSLFDITQAMWNYFAGTVF